MQNELFCDSDSLTVNLLMIYTYANATIIPPPYSIFLALSQFSGHLRILDSLPEVIIIKLF